MCLHGDSESVTLAVKIHSCHLFILLGFLSSECPYFFFALCVWCHVLETIAKCNILNFIVYFLLHYTVLGLIMTLTQFPKLTFQCGVKWGGIVFAGGYGVLLKTLSYVYWTVLVSLSKITWPFVSRYNSNPLVFVSLPVLYYFDYYNFV